jgi:hypothetical protein
LLGMSDVRDASSFLGVLTPVNLLALVSGWSRPSA